MKIKMILLIIVLLIFGVSYKIYKKVQYVQNFKYTTNNVYYKKHVIDKTFDVAITNIRREKGKEDIYEFELTREKAPDINSPFKLSKSEFEKYIGIGNNSISGEVYFLEIVVPVIGYFDDNTDNIFREIDIYRYSFFGQDDFSESEIEDVARLSVSVFNQMLNNNNPDLSLIKNKINFMAIQSSNIVRSSMNFNEMIIDMSKLEN